MTSTPDSQQFETELVRLYQAGDYAAAFAWADAHGPAFPERTLGVAFWRANLACLIGQPDEAMRTLEQASAAGYWFPAQRLLDDTDFAILYGRPEFERLLERFEQQRREARASAPQVLHVQPPESGAPPFPTLLAIHTNYTGAQRMGEWVQPARAAGWLLALPQSSQVSGPGAFVWNDEGWALDELRGLFARLRAEAPVDEGRLVLAGVGLGAARALSLALDGDIPARAVVLFEPYIPQLAALEPLLASESLARPPCWIIASERYPSMYKVAKGLAPMLRAAGVACELELFPNLGVDMAPPFQERLLAVLSTFS